MPDLSRTPIYNLKAVMHETGLTAELLHAWERRYDLPQPQRSPGGRRLYSAYDVAVLNWLKARQNEGLSISRAVERWKDLADAGRDPLAEYSPPGRAGVVLPSEAPDDQVTRLRGHYLEACRSFDETAADQVLNLAFSLFPIEKVCQEFLQHGLRQLGDEWARGNVSVQQEHFASDLAMRRLASLIASTPPPFRSTTIMTVCPPGEWHAFPLLLQALLLRQRGFRVVNLGANVPLDRLSEAIAAIHPSLVVLAAQTLIAAASLRELALRLRSLNTPAVYGGLIFNRLPRLRERIPAHFLAETIQGGAQAIDQLGDHPLPVADLIEVEPSVQATLQSFRQQRSRIEAGVLASDRLRIFPAEQIRTANAFLGDDLAAVLELGDPKALETDFQWIRETLDQQGSRPEWLEMHLSEYRRIVQEVMDRESTLIVDWLSTLN